MSTDSPSVARRKAVGSAKPPKIAFEPSLGRYLALGAVLAVMVVALVETHNAMALWPLMIVAVGVFCADPAVIAELVKLVRRS